MHIVRTLLPTEFDLLRQHLLRLDPDDRQRRFAGQMSDEAVAAHIGAIDRFRAVVVAWIEDGSVRGAAELLRRSLTIARNRGLEQVLMVCLAENGRMRHLADKFRGKLIDLGGEIEATVRLLAPDGLSLWQEAVDHGHAAVGALLAQWSPRAGRNAPGV